MRQKWETARTLFALKNDAAGGGKAEAQSGNQTASHTEGYKIMDINTLPIQNLTVKVSRQDVTVTFFKKTPPQYSDYMQTGWACRLKALGGGDV